jgi:hypothetical protein
MLGVSDATEVLVREYAHGALAVFDVSVILVLLNYLWGKRGYWHHGAGCQIAIAILIFISAQLMRSGVFWIEYGLLSARGWEIDPSLGTISLTIAPFMVLMGLVRILWTITAVKWRWPILIINVVLAVVLPVAVHILIFKEFP